MSSSGIMIEKTLFLSLFVTATVAGFLDRPKEGCPEPVDVKPCECIDNYPFTRLECRDIAESYVLRDVFKKSSGYAFNEVRIAYSTLQYLPHDLFETVRVRELSLGNVTLIELFDKPPVALKELRALFIANMKVLRGMFWRLLKPLSGLRILDIFYNRVKVLDKDFSENVPKGLKQLTLYGTETKHLAPGVFADLLDLVKVEVSGGKLKTLTRDIFSVPFNGQYLYFDNNQISVIPDDLFTQMPNLEAVRLGKNRIATLPESAMGRNFGRVTTLYLDDNPLKCDCLMQWITRNKPLDLSGTCSSPNDLFGRELKDLSPQDFNC